MQFAAGGTALLGAGEGGLGAGPNGVYGGGRGERSCVDAACLSPCAMARCHSLCLVVICLRPRGVASARAVVLRDDDNRAGKRIFRWRGNAKVGKGKASACLLFRQSATPIESVQGLFDLEVAGCSSRRPMKIFQATQTAAVLQLLGCAGTNPTCACVNRTCYCGVRWPGQATKQCGTARSLSFAD